MRLICSVAVMLGHIGGVFIAAVERQEANGPGAYWTGHIVEALNPFAVPMYFAIAGWAVLAKRTAARQPPHVAADRAQLGAAVRLDGPLPAVGPGVGHQRRAGVAARAGGRVRVGAARVPPVVHVRLHPADRRPGLRGARTGREAAVGPGRGAAGARVGALPHGGPGAVDRLGPAALRLGLRRLPGGVRAGRRDAVRPA
ncbi:hypothetical protein LUW77_12260 [Streptomyces radiopugnans]|nr:hypothetical protein LUW77_12260 [Streptomyces radiopugnans]